MCHKTHGAQERGDEEFTNRVFNDTNGGQGSQAGKTFKNQQTLTERTGAFKDRVTRELRRHTWDQIKQSDMREKLGHRTGGANTQNSPGAWHYSPLPEGASSHRGTTEGGKRVGTKAEAQEEDEHPGGGRLTETREVKEGGAREETGGTRSRRRTAGPRPQPWWPTVEEPEAEPEQLRTKAEPEGRGSPVELVDRWVTVEGRELGAEVDHGARAAMAERGARAAMVEQGAWEASMAGSPPPKKLLGKLFISGGHSGGADAGGRSGGADVRGSGEPDGTSRGSGEPDGTSRGSGEPDGTSRGSGEPDGTSRGTGEPDGTSRGTGEPDGTSRGSGEPDGTSRRELDGTSRGSGELDGTSRGSGGRWRGAGTGEPDETSRGTGELDGTSRGTGELDGTSSGSGELDGTSRGSGELDGTSRGNGELDGTCRGTGGRRRGAGTGGRWRGVGTGESEAPSGLDGTSGDDGERRGGISYSSSVSQSIKSPSMSSSPRCTDQLHLRRGAGGGAPLRTHTIHGGLPCGGHCRRLSHLIWRVGLYFRDDHAGGGGIWAGGGVP